MVHISGLWNSYLCLLSEVLPFERGSGIRLARDLDVVRSYSVISEKIISIFAFESCIRKLLYYPPPLRFQK